MSLHVKNQDEISKYTLQYLEKYCKEGFIKELFTQAFEGRNTIKLNGLATLDYTRDLLSCFLEEAKERRKEELKKEAEQRKVITIKSQEVSLAENDVKKAKEALATAESNLDKVAKSFCKQKKILERIGEDIEESKDRIAMINEMLEKSYDIVLVHKTASLKQLMENQWGVFYVTKQDEEFFKRMQILPDKVVSEVKANFVSKFPYGFCDKNSEYKKSIIEFCEMVINFAMEYSSIKVLYSNEDIAKILQMNGYTE